MLKIGTDIVKIGRISKLMERDKFLQKVFTDREIKYFASIDFREESIAGSFSAKESVSKVFGTGIGKLSFKDMEILRDKNGKPYLSLSAKGRKLAGEKGIGHIDLSISHQDDYAISVACGDSHKTLAYERPEDLPVLKERPADSHKGTFGKVGLIGGSQGMSGSIIMSSRAALRMGSGLVYTFVPGIISNIVQIKSLENIVYSFGEGNFSYRDIENIIGKARDMDAIGFGPGMAGGEEVLKILKDILDLNIPMVIDADGINAVSKERSLLKDRNLIITPHRLEMARLLGIDLEEINERPVEIAINTSKTYNIIVVLKGHRTIVTDGQSLFINETGNSGMASGGSGDVLTGIISSLLGQGYGAYDAGVLGVHIHGLAGDFAGLDIGEDSMIASDIINYIGRACREIRRWQN